MKIPTDNRWTQTNEGDVLGVLNETYRCSLDTPAVIQQSKKPFNIFSVDDDEDFKYLMSLVYFSNKYVAVTSGGVYTGDLDGNDFSISAVFEPNTTLSSDAILFKDSSTTQLIVTLDNNFARWNGSASVSYTLGTLTSDVPHPLCIFESMTTYKLAIGNGNTVKTYDTSYNANSTVLTLPIEYQVTTLAYRNGYLYVGTKNLNGGEAKVYVWNGSTANADYEIPVGGSWVFSMTPYDQSVAVLPDTGELFLVSGNSRQKLAGLPVFYDPNSIWQDSSGLQLNGKCFHRGMRTVGDTIFMNIDGTVDRGINMESGLWIFDPNVGLYHAGNTSSDKLVLDAGLSVTDSVITTSSAHNLKDGDAVQFIATSGLSGIDTDVVYYASVQSSTTIKLAKSRNALINKRYVTITGTAGSSDKLCYIPNTDFGTGIGASSGAIGLVSPEDTTLKMWAFPVIWGARADKPDGTAYYSLNGMTDSWNISRFTTQRIYTNSKRTVWNELTTFIDGFALENEEIIVKYQTGNKTVKKTEVLRGVWLDENKINTNNTTLDEDEWGDLEVGDEITIVDGVGRGRTAHITQITASSTVHTVEIDEDLGTESSPVYFYAENFVKTKSHSSTRELADQISDTIDKKSSWIRFRFEIRGFNNKVYLLDLENTKDR